MRKQKNLLLTPEALRLLELLAEKYGTEAAAMEAAIRKLAKAEKVG